MGEDLRSLSQLIRDFTERRDWQQFHTPKNLACAIASEAGELVALYRWHDKADASAVASELADVLIFSLRMCDALGLYPDAVIRSKLRENERRYPVERCRGLADKYSEL